MQTTKRATPRPVSPAIIGLTPKSLIGEERAIASAIEAAKGIDQEPVPVLFGKGPIGWVVSSPWWAKERAVYYWPGKKKPNVPAPYQCGFTSYDDLISEINSGKYWKSIFSKVHSSATVANNWYDFWTIGGDPSAGAYTGSAFTARQFDDTTTGSVYHGGNVSTDTKHATMMYGAASGNPVTLMLYDRVLTYEACTFNANSNQGMTNTLTAQRYGSNGAGGLKIIMTAQTLFNSTAFNITQMRYTDDAGNTLQSVPQSPVPAGIVSVTAPTATLGSRIFAPTTTAATIPWGPFMPLAAGDGGVQLINDWTTSAANTGSACIVLGRPLALLPMVNATTTHMMDLVQQVAAMPRVYDGACLHMLGYATVTSIGTISAGFDVAWG